MGADIIVLLDTINKVKAEKITMEPNFFEPKKREEKFLLKRTNKVQTNKEESNTNLFAVVVTLIRYCSESLSKYSLNIASNKPRMIKGDPNSIIRLYISKIPKSEVLFNSLVIMGNNNIGNNLLRTFIKP